MIDRFGRQVDYLRVSVTDRCNLRCRYCTPRDGIRLLDKSQVLSYEEILRVVRAGTGLGLGKVRLTGGDPLVRKGLTGFIANLRLLDGIREVVLTTNGLLLGEMAQELKEAGISRVNVSLDSLDPDRYAMITRGGELGTVVDGILRAREAGLGVKLNVVVMRGVNEDEVADFLEFGAQHGFEVRFLEFMPLVSGVRHRDYFVPLDAVLSRLQESVPLAYVGYDGVAKSYRYRGTRIGFIVPMTDPFCRRCSRLRLTAAGTLLPCLFAGSGVELRPLLRSGADDEQLAGAFARAVALKPRAHHGQCEPAGILPERGLSPKPEPLLMRQIGG